MKIGGMHLQLNCMNSNFPGLSQALLSCLCFLKLTLLTLPCSVERKNSLNFGVTEGKMGHQELAETILQCLVFVLAGHLACRCLALQDRSCCRGLGCHSSHAAIKGTCSGKDLEKSSLFSKEALPNFSEC